MGVVALMLAWLFRASFRPEQVLAANDGPLAVLVTQALQVPASFAGYWTDLYWVGSNGGSVLVSITYFIFWVLGPLGFAKFYAPLALLFLGACAWVYFRSLKLSAGLCGLGALAAALNMNYFSNTCWGVGTRSLTLGTSFLALAALNARRLGHPWLNAALAGFAVGLGIIEGADNGAIFSLFIAAYVVFQSVAEEAAVRRKLVACGRLAVVAVCAALIAAQALGNLVGLGIKGVPGAQQDTETKARQWDFATQWSLPKLETLRVIIPGLFGYRLDTPQGGEYWGGVGRYAPMPQAQWRSSGAGEYAGVLVVLVGCWAVYQSLRRSRGGPHVFSETERRHLRFWATMLVVAVLLAWGRHAPFYRLVYELPFFSVIRNPMKFMHPAHMVLLILFGYGLLGLSRRYLATVTAPAGGLRAWWAKALPFEKHWTLGALFAAGLGGLGFLLYSVAQPGLVKYLSTVGFVEEARALAIARFSVHEVGVFVAVLVVSIGLVTLIQSGAFAGRRARWAMAALGLVLAVDLGRADLPWILYYNYPERYASYPLLEVLRDEPYLHRVTAMPARMLSDNQNLYTLNRVYQAEWLQYAFPYYGVQALDIPQEPRPSASKTNYLKAVSRNMTRLWELTNTRYVLGLAGLADALNQQVDPVQKRFRTTLNFALGNAGNSIAATTNETGPWALLEFTGALPRAKLYTDWQVITNTEAALVRLGDPAFDPAQSVLVREPIAPPNGSARSAASGTVEFAGYAPTRIELRVKASATSVLLHNDQWDPDWAVWVDETPGRLLCCNAIMRGVAVPPGEHRITWRFQPRLTRLKITCVAMGVGVLLCGLLLFVRQPKVESD
jgi:hypothetical protein